MRSLLLLAVALVAACNAASPARSPARAAAPEPVQSRTTEFAAAVPAPAPAAPRPTRPARAVSLRFDLKGHAFPLPLVRGTVGGCETWMLVDTGANSHVLASWLARKAGLSLKPLGDVGTDHAGRAVTTYSVDRPPVEIDSWGPVREEAMLVTEVPKEIEQLGIGAFVSPQWLAEGDDVVVMDFPAKRMRTAQLDEAVQALGTRGQALVPAGGRLCEDLGSSIRGLAFVVPATIEGRAVDLLLDTGAPRTDVLSASRVGVQLAPRSVPSKERMYAASGLVQTRVVKGASVKVGDYAITTEVDIVPGTADPVCPRDGVVSMDVLKSCVLVLGKKQMVGRCGG